MNILFLQITSNNIKFEEFIKDSMNYIFRSIISSSN